MHDAIKVTIFLPLYDNDGNLIDQNTWRWWNDRLTSLFAGFTDVGVVSGWWRGYSDQNRWIMMNVRSMAEAEVIRELLRKPRRGSGQEAMYLDPVHPVHFDEVT